MRLISKKTPFVLAGAEMIRRKVTANAKRKARQQRLGRIAMGAGTLLVAGTAIYLIQKRQRQKRFLTVDDDGRYVDIREEYAAT